MWESLGIRVLREHEIAGSNPVILTGNDHMTHVRCRLLRWGPCWYGQAAVNRRVAGSIPATAAEYQKWRDSCCWMWRLVLSQEDVGSIPTPAICGSPPRRTVGRHHSDERLHRTPGSLTAAASTRLYVSGVMAARLIPNQSVGVRFPGDVFQTIRPCRAAECSPACHAGDRRFESGRGCSSDCRCDRCPAGFHKAGPLGSIPRPATLPAFTGSIRPGLHAAGGD